MSKRLVVVGGATGVAGLVLGASIVFGPAAVTPTDSSVPSDIGAPEVDGPGGGGISSATIRGIEYTTFEVDADGQLRGMRLRAASSKAKSMGITELVRPDAEIRLGSQRAITITADKADMEMEDAKPRAGQFTGNVVITLYQAPAGTKLIIDADNPASEAFIQQRIFLDDPLDPDDAISFSIEDDTIQTNGPVHATGPQVDFYGIGLRLAYNTQRKRIEQLLINEGRYLIYNPEADAPGFTARADGDTSADSLGSSSSETASEASDPDTQQPQAPSQFYAIEFADNVVIREGLDTELAGDKLTIDFSLGTEAVSPQPLTIPGDPSSGARLPSYLIAPAAFASSANGADEVVRTTADPTSTLIPGEATDTAPAPLVAIPTANAERSLFTHDPARDLVVTWTGKMQLTPHANKPDVLADEKDARLVLTGQNTYAQTTRDGELQRLETARLEHLLSEQRTTASAKAQGPARILSDALGGEVTGQQLTLQQQEGAATVLGPGQLTYTNQDDGKQLTITWQNRLDLELYTQPDDNSTRILGVKTATFDGDVTARHTDFDLDAKTLTLAFNAPDPQREIENTPSEINASGSVAVVARGDAQDERFDIKADRLTISLGIDTDGEPFASTIRAVDNVDVRRPGTTLTCDRVQVELNPPSKTETTADDRFAQVQSILAVGTVRANLAYDDRKIDLVADQLIADVEADRLTLSSNDPRFPAEVADLNNDRKLTGQLVVMDDQAQQMDITGAGSLATRLADPNAPDAGIEDAFLAISWDKAMRFNNVTGLAEFHENVRSESRRTADASELACDHLTIRFSPDYEHDPRRLVEDEGKDNHERQVRSAVATGNVKFTASAWQPFDTDKLDNRILLQGPKLTFTNQPPTAPGQSPVETLVVDGKGLMMLEDYRDQAQANAEDKEDNSALTMTGKGITLFNWNEQMTLNARSNTATFLDTVQMTHKPDGLDGDNRDTVQLDCNQLVADLTDTGGLAGWLSDDAPDARVTTITANDNVRLLQQKTRSMRGEDMKFTAKTNRLELWSALGRAVVIQDLKRDTSTNASKVTWDLTNDRLEIEKLQGGVAPLD